MVNLSYLTASASLLVGALAKLKYLDYSEIGDRHYTKTWLVDMAEIDKHFERHSRFEMVFGADDMAIVSTPEFIADFLGDGGNEIDEGHAAKIRFVDCRDEDAWYYSHVDEPYSWPGNPVSLDRQITHQGAANTVYKQADRAQNIPRYMVFLDDDGLIAPRIAKEYARKIVDNRDFKDQRIVIVYGGYQAMRRYDIRKWPTKFFSF